MAAVLLPFADNMVNYFNLGPRRSYRGGGWAGNGLGLASRAVPLMGGFGGGGNYHITSMNVNDPNMFNTVRNAQREDKEENRAKTAAILGGIATVVLAGVSALSLRCFCNDKKDLNNARECIRILNAPNDRYGITGPMRARMEPLAKKYLEVVEAKASRSRNIMILTGAALLTAGSAFIAGMLSLQWLITASIIAGVIIAAMAAFAIVWHCTSDATNITEVMKRNMLQIQQQLHHEAFAPGGPEGQ